MSVFDDPMKELEQLQAQLLEQEEWFQRELDSAKRMIGDLPEARQTAAAPRSVAAAQPPVRNYANNYGAQPVRMHAAPAAIPEIREEPVPKKKGVKGLLVIAALELLGIGGIAAYWLLFLL